MSGGATYLCDKSFKEVAIPMSKSFKVVDLGNENAEHLVSAQTPEEAAQSAIGVPLTRSGTAKNLRAKVYWQTSPQQPLLVVRLYERVDQS